jgi:hypothetical protein
MQPNYLSTVKKIVGMDRRKATEENGDPWSQYQGLKEGG